MSLQKKTIHRYRQLFPNETLKEISARTGIQITRVHRLFGGKGMKVTELEAFEEAISLRAHENQSFSKLTRAIEEASTILTSDELEKLTLYVERRILNKSYGRLYFSASRSEKQIA